MTNQTYQEALDQARNEALKDAIEKAADSFQIRSREELVQQEVGDEYFKRYTKSMQREVHGRVVEVRDEGSREERPAPDVLQIVYYLEAKVVVEKQDRNSAFKVSAWIPGNDAGIFREGEEVVLEILSSLDCWVTVFNVYADGTVSVLLPNKRISQNRLVANVPLLLPDHDDPTQRFIHFNVGVPEGRQRTEEKVLIVATLQEYAFLSSALTDFGDSYIPTYEAAYSEFNNWILQIPIFERAETEVSYTIFK